MNGMKYLVFVILGGAERMFIFPREVKHADFAKILVEWGNPVRGGFVYQWDDGSLHVGGGAFSLALHCDKEKDNALLRKELAV